MIDIDHQAEEYAKLAREIYRYKHLSHPNIIPIYKTMIIQDKFYAEMPYMMGSLESIITYQPLNSPADIPLIMSNRYRYGFTVDCIAIELKETLKGLSYLHGERLFHENISAGHVFVKPSHPQILLAFAGTMYEHYICNHDTREWISSSSSITAWAAAPEVVNFVMITIPESLTYG